MPEFSTVCDKMGVWSVVQDTISEDWEKMIFNFVESCVVSWQI